MLTKPQWEALARFAGVEIEWLGGSESFPYMANQRGGNAAFGWLLPWLPTSDWSDFGPLWVLLQQWLMSADAASTTIVAHEFVRLNNEIKDAVWHKDHKRLMQAGCALGAAIGATMEDKA